MSRYERANIRNMSGYAPGEQPKGGRIIKLNTNENPYPPNEAVMQALRNVDPESLRKYPNPTAEGFREVAAGAHGVTPDNVIATNGGDELLRLAITTFVEPKQPIGTADPSYSLYPVLADIHDSPTVSVSLTSDWQLPADFATKMNDQNVGVTFVVNPHAPTGILRNVNQLARLAEQLNGILVVDEAYVDFVDPDLHHDTTGLIRDFDNVLILRTLSKGYSLAGLRFGYGLGSTTVIEPMQWKTKDSYNTDALSQALATAALENREQAAQTWQSVRNERTRVAAELAGLGIESLPSQSNFVLATIPASYAGGAKAVYETLKSNGILVRYFNQDRLTDKVRITIGTPQENDALISELKACMNE